MYSDIKFQFKSFFITKITCFLLMIYSEQLQLFIDATPVTGFHLSCRSVTRYQKNYFPNQHKKYFTICNEDNVKKWLSKGKRGAKHLSLFVPTKKGRLTSQQTVGRHLVTNLLVIRPHCVLLSSSTYLARRNGVKTILISHFFSFTLFSFHQKFPIQNFNISEIAKNIEKTESQGVL